MEVAPRYKLLTLLTWFTLMIWFTLLTWFTLRGLRGLRGLSKRRKSPIDGWTGWIPLSLLRLSRI